MTAGISVESDVSDVRQLMDGSDPLYLYFIADKHTVMIEPGP